MLRFHSNIDAEELENTLLQQQAFEEAGDAVPSVLGRYARTSEVILRSSCILYKSIRTIKMIALQKYPSIPLHIC